MKETNLLTIQLKHVQIHDRQLFDAPAHSMNAIVFRCHLFAENNFIFETFYLKIFEILFIPTDLSTAYSKSASVTNSLQKRAACKAASLHTFAMSAPENPGVKMANLFHQ